ncbi:MAG: pantothenate kinase [Spirochaetaceae bacterium]|jgi:type II pantothenate kinase|nr:pantothenate kinase [Spirochaetaceae bacterium]
MIIGIDIGSTTTKAVAVTIDQAGSGAVQDIKKVKTKAADVITSAAGALGKMLVENSVKIGDIQRIMITGAGASKINADLFGIPTEKVDEIQAIGIGGMFLSGKDDIIIANIGTGTAIIDAHPGAISHLGGSGVGGGTILGLAKRILSLSDLNDVMELAERGNLNQVDLLMEDIMDMNLSFLNPESTASNFGKMLDTARNEDIALGILNMVYQVIGMLGVFAAKIKNTDRIVVTGNGSDNPVGKRVLQVITGLYSVYFEYPPDAEYTTAIGAGLSWNGRR